MQCHQLLVDHCRLQDFANTIKLLLRHHLLQSSAKAILALSIVSKQKTRINFVHHHIHEADSAKADSWAPLNELVLIPLCRVIGVIWCVKSSDKTFFTKTTVCLWIFLSSSLNNPSPRISVSHLLLLPIVLLWQISSMKLMNLREFGNQNLLLSAPTEKGKEIVVVWDFQVLKLVNLYKTYWLKT